MDRLPISDFGWRIAINSINPLNPINSINAISYINFIAMDNLEFETLTAGEFDEYLKNHIEGEYLLIDVRQESEYERGHIPGARLMPLAEVETRLYSLPADQDLIFYCRNGGRSQWAASLAGEGEVCQKKVYHLMGGLLVRNGRVLPGYPKIQVFERARELDQLLTAAMDLEKGAWRFYRYARDRLMADPVGQLFEQISIAEKGHAKLIYRYLQKFNSDPPPFEKLYDSLKGDLLEGGQSFKEACESLEAVAAHSCSEFIDLALAIEFEAYDLYRVMADKTGHSAARETFLAIAQAEKGHMRALARSLEKCR
jgi:rubrerythrin/rhodanese-related sulfurtransferase